jgi:hypothetical protein
MTVRLTQSRPRYPRRSRQPYPTDGGPASSPEDSTPGTGGAPDGSVGPDAVTPQPATPQPAPTGSRSRVADRQALRAGRRTRRNLAILCGVVVAVCLVLTILIVNMARNRPPGAEITMPVSTASALVAADRSHPLSADSIIPNRGAPAPEGGNP